MSTEIATNGAPLASANPLPASERFITATATLTRPANTTAYTANDAVTDTAATATSVSISVNNDDPFSIEAIRVETVDTGFATGAGSFECWVYGAAIVPAADNAAFTSSHTGLIGRFTGTWFATSDGSAVILVPVEGSRRVCKPLSGAKTLNLTFKTVVAVTSSASSTVLNIVVEGFQGRA